ncbi:Septin-7 [Liparis tanakae]|uniref:Septin-7 n=1 Tax=Liparis tanakae TaxID=230148 RepID=A0A4Z2EIZ9_9TELE|nr:Septin-7 [Liparis tanakae]
MTLLVLVRTSDGLLPQKVKAALQESSLLRMDTWTRESGLGKSTLINSLFLTDLYSKDYPGPSQRIKKTVQVEQSKVLVKEGGVQLTLTIVDTPGFGDAVDNSNCWQPVINFIDSKCEDFLNAESRVNRRSMPDNRVHCCLYFIAPSGHG